MMTLNRFTLYRKIKTLIPGLALLLLVSVTASAQDLRFGNEWVDYGKQYWKIKISQTGMQRLTYEELAAAEFPVSIDPRRFQGYFHGQEIALFVAGTEDESFDPGDYIEFYGTRNRSDLLDSELYENGTDDQPHLTYTFYDNNTYVFLTFTKSSSEFGKRMELDDNDFSGLSPEAYHIRETAIDPTSEYNYGPLYPRTLFSINYVGGLLSNFEAGEGRTEPTLWSNRPPKDYDFDIEGYVSGTGFTPQLRMNIMGKLNTNHFTRVYAYGGTGEPTEANVIYDSVPTHNYTYELLETELPTSAFPAAGEGNFRIRVEPQDIPPDILHNIMTVGYVQIWYPQAYNMRSRPAEDFLMRENPSGLSYIEIEQIGTDSATVFDISDMHNVRRVRSEVSGNILRAAVSGTQEQKHLHVASNAGVTNLTADLIEQVEFPRILDAANFLIITHPGLRVPSENYDDPVQAYADFRASVAGGSYIPDIVEIYDLYNLFSFGEFHPLAIRRYADYMLNFGNPQFLFILSEGNDILLGRTKSRPESINVPPWGFPPSDHMFTERLTGDIEYVPAIPTGRLAARNPQHVENYLNKVIEHEAVQLDAQWTKNILHLTGGKDARENIIFKAYGEGWKNVAEGNYLGANVSTISKQTTNFVEFINVSDEVNEGVMLMTFFGHSSPGFTDIDIGYVTNPRFGYENKGRYPMVILNGCSSGDIFPLGGNTFGENWMLAKDKGSILFLSHTSLGFAGHLRRYTQTFYETAFADRDYINQPVGVVLQESLRRYLRSTGENEIAFANAQQVLLQGDPAIRLVKMQRPDYYIDNTRAWVEPLDGPSLTSRAEKFNIKVDVSNLGIIDTDRKAVGLRVRRRFSDGSQVSYSPQYYSYVVQRDTLTFEVTTTEEERDKGQSISTFDIYIDFEDSVSEIRETNNSATIQAYFLRGSMLALAPKEFSIVSENPVNFIAQNTDPFSTLRDYVFELDTVNTFDSPLKKREVVKGYITPQWTEDLPVKTDSTVYYWRVRYAEIGPQDDSLWATSSFIYIPGSPQGWSQAHFQQFEKDEQEGLFMDDTARVWRFRGIENRIEAVTHGRGHPDKGQYKMWLNGQLVVNADCRGDRIIGMAFNGETGALFNALPEEGCGGSLAAAAIPRNYAGRTPLQEYVANLDNGDWTVLMSGQGMGYGPFSVGAVFPQLGLSLEEFSAKTANNAPFIFVGRKGAPLGTGLLIVPDSTQDVRTAEISMNYTISALAREGIVNSTRIGPAAEWGTVYRDFRNLTGNDTASWQLDIIGLTNDGDKTMLREDVREDAHDISDIDPEEFRYLELQATVRDSSVSLEVPKLPIQLRRWQVIYKEVPEAILLFDTLSYKENTVLEVTEGDSVRVNFLFRNISANDFEDPVQVRFTVLNETTNTTTEFTETVGTLRVGETLPILFKVFSLDFVGKNTFTVYANPQIQAEQLYENNVLQASFEVVPDDINPVLDVAFDGIHILDGDIVSPQPLISVSLRDENPYLIREDTVGINLYLSACDSCEQTRVNFSEENVSWTASPDNNFRVEYRPERLTDGTYLLTVEAEDVSGNASGVEPYRVNFEVINDSKITEFYPYPNPFSTNMRFVFTLTGSEVPEDIKIQIMTVTGKVIRTILREELGPIRIGNNISEFRWDGTDEFGDRLANGVYLYKVMIRDSDTDFEHFETKGDKMFKNDIGKIYLMR